jgi:hypothetical protein
VESAALITCSTRSVQRRPHGDGYNYRRALFFTAIETPQRRALLLQQLQHDRLTALSIQWNKQQLQSAHARVGE